MGQMVAWAAGFFDGEGSIALQSGGSGHLTLRLKVGQTNPEPLVRLVELFGGKICTSKKKTSGGGTLYTWGVNSKEAAEALAKMRPWLTVKSKRADIALAFWAEEKDRIGQRRLTGEDIERHRNLRNQFLLLRKA